MRVCGCIIARNEERCIERCIRSYLDIVDDVIVVDTGSTDRTVEIAKSLGARIFHFNWIDDFAAAKNIALENTDADWVIFLDADEFFRPGDSKKLLSFMRRSIDAPRAQVLVVRLTNIEADGSQCMDQPYLQSSRVFRGNIGIRYHGAIHEDIRLPSGELCSARSLYNEDIVILHDGYMKSIVKEKVQRNHAILLEELERDPSRTEICDYLAHGFSMLGEYENALVYARRCMETPGVHDFHSVRSLSMCVDLYNRLGYGRNALMEMIEKARPAFRDKAQFYNILGSTYARRAQFVEAMQAFDRYMALIGEEKERIFVETLVTPALMATTLLNIARVYMQCGEMEKALDVARRAMQTHRTDTAVDLYLTLAHDRPQREIIETLQGVYAMDDIPALEGLLEILRRKRVDEVYYSFFEAVYQATRRKDLHFLTMLTGIGEGAMAVPHYLERYALTGEPLYLSKALTAALLSGKEESLYEVRAVATAEYRAFVDFWLDLPGGDDRPFSVDDFVAVLVDLMTYPSGRAVLDRWITMGRLVSPILTQRVAMLLYMACRYDLAMPYMEEVYEAYAAQGVPHAADFARDCCKGFYYLGDYEKSEWYLNQVIARGKNLAEVGAFARFLAMKAQDEHKRKELDRTASMLEGVAPMLWKDEMTPVQDENARKALISLIERVTSVNRAVYVHWYARILNRQGNVEEAERQFIRAYEMQPRLAVGLLEASHPNCEYAYAPEERERVEDCPVCGTRGRAHMCVDMVQSETFFRGSPIRVWMACPECGHGFARDWPVGKKRPEWRMGMPGEAEMWEPGSDPRALERDARWTDFERAEFFSEESMRRVKTRMERVG